MNHRHPPEFAGRDAANLTPFLTSLLAGESLSEENTSSAFEAIMTGEAHHAEMGALLALLATRLPTTDELTGAARVMRDKVDSLETGFESSELLDTAGTGGAPKTFNVSTAAAIVAASSGARVAKHGNRSRTGRGSAEVLEALGVNVGAPRAVQKRCLQEINVCFCFAIHHHPAAKHAMPVRKALGFPTLFNLLGPLTNPASAGRQVMGVYDAAFIPVVAQTLARLGSIRAIVMHSEDGLDEFSLGAPSVVAQVDEGSITEYRIDPVELGLQSSPYEALQARDLDHAVELVRNTLSGEERGPARDIVLLNAAAAIHASGLSDSIESGLPIAAQSIDFGDAGRTLEKLIELSNMPE
ncbi:MAG: anthranilate phosphoribosyltransferase [Phycisphaerae bacterium]|nr:anthranilate phosphoribosyltransferase [Phycisphaerae bacterium]